MAIFRTGFSKHEGAGAETAVSTAHTVRADDTVCIVCIEIPATIDVTVVPKWNVDAESFTLIKQTTSSGLAGDIHTYTYALLSPTVKTDNITWTVDSSNSVASLHVNYKGTVTTSLANAVKYLVEKVNDSAATTSVLASAGTSGSTLLVWGGFEGADGDPATNATSFVKVAEGNSIGTSYYMAEKFAGGASACTITWSVSDENAAQMIELIPEADLPTQAELATAAVVWLDTVDAYKQRLT